MDTVWLVFYIEKENAEFLGVFAGLEDAKAEVEYIYRAHLNAYWHPDDENPNTWIYELYPTDLTLGSPYVSVEPWVVRKRK